MPYTNTETGTTAGSGGLIGGAQGAVLPSASTITVTDFIHEVSGSTAINTISGGIANKVYVLIPSSGATWTLTAAGNIDEAVTPDGHSVFLVYDGTTFYVLSNGGVANYVKKSGDTMTGTLTTPNVAATDITVSNTATIAAVSGNLPVSGSGAFGGSVDANAILALTSTTKAFLPPRMTTAQKTAIAAPATGSIVFDTNNARPQIYNGSRWFFGDFYNVRDFGAKGDDSTNDYTSIQAALDAANAAGGGTVFVPKGTYRIGTGLTIGDNTRLCGDGFGAIIKGTADIVLLTNKDTTSTGNSGIVIENIAFLGNYSGSGAATEGIQNIYLSYVTRSTLRNVRSSFAKRNGIVVEYGKYVTVEDCLIHNNAINGLYLSGTDLTAVRGCRTHLNARAGSGAGIQLSVAWFCTVASNICVDTPVDTASAAYGISLGNDSRHTSVVGNFTYGITAESSSAPAVAPPYNAEHIEPGTFDGVNQFGFSFCTISGNTVTSPSGYDLTGISLTRSNDNTISGNRITYCSSYGVNLVGSSRNVVRGNEIANNGNGPRGFTNPSSYRYGVNIERIDATYLSDDNIVQGNRIYDSQGVQTQYGIRVDANVANTALLDNAITVSTNPTSINASVNVTQRLNVDSATLARASQTYGGGAPVSGTWRQGDIVWLTAPASGGFIGYVCTAAGAPGTWKGFGTIA